MAGSSGPICTEFPMTTFSAKILTRHPLQKFPSKKLNSISCKNNWRVIAIFSFTLKKKNSLESSFKETTSRHVYISLNRFILHFFARENLWTLTRNERASWQTREYLIRNVKFVSKIVIAFLLIQSFFKSNSFFCKPLACHDIFFRVKRSLKSPVSNITQDVKERKKKDYPRIWF